MGLSWHHEGYSIMVSEMHEYLENLVPNLTLGEIHEITCGLVNIMIDNGAVDPT